MPVLPMVTVGTREQLLPGLDAGAVPGVADAEILADVADPAEVEEVDADLLRHGQRLRDQPGVERVDEGAVGGRGGGGVLHRIEARGARHVLHDDVGIARDVAAEMPRQHARVVIVAAAGREADHDANGLALVEGCDVLRRGGCRVAARSKSQSTSAIASLPPKHIPATTGVRTICYERVRSINVTLGAR